MVIAYSVGEVHDGYGAIDMRGYASEIYIRQNLVYGGNGVGLRNESANNVYWIGNTVVDNGKFGIWFSGDSSYWNACTLLGNAFSQNGQIDPDGEIALHSS